ncbi:hypothetical protein H0H93_009036, partial [Arthromyces matolae]
RLRTKNLGQERQSGELNHDSILNPPITSVHRVSFVKATAEEVFITLGFTSRSAILPTNTFQDGSSTIGLNATVSAGDVHARVEPEDKDVKVLSASASHAACGRS